MAIVNDLYTMYHMFLIFYFSIHQQHFSFQIVCFQPKASGSYFSDRALVSFLNYDACMSVADFLCVYVTSCFAVSVRHFTVFTSYFHFCDGYYLQPDISGCRISRPRSLYEHGYAQLRATVSY